MARIGRWCAQRPPLACLPGCAPLSPTPSTCLPPRTARSSPRTFGVLEVRGRGMSPPGLAAAPCLTQRRRQERAAAAAAECTAPTLLAHVCRWHLPGCLAVLTRRRSRKTEAARRGRRPGPSRWCVVPACHMPPPPHLLPRLPLSSSGHLCLPHWLFRLPHHPHPQRRLLHRWPGGSRGPGRLPRYGHAQQLCGARWLLQQRHAVAAAAAAKWLLRRRRRCCSRCCCCCCSCCCARHRRGGSSE